MYRFLLPLLIGFILSSCASTNHSKKLLERINTELKKDYKIDYGKLIATYDLIKIHKTNHIIAKDFCLIINDEHRNDLFLKQFKKRYKTQDDLYSEAAIKVSKMKDLILRINNRYNFLTHSEITHFKKKPKNALAIPELTILDKIASTIPIMLPQHNPKITSYYGLRKHPHKGQKKFHCGIDFADRKSTPIYSSAFGIVTNVSRLNGYGNIVEIKHSNKFKTKYAHLKKIYVNIGDHVIRGQKIAIQGNTGNSTGDHLHFEILLNDKHIDPFDFIAHAL